MAETAVKNDASSCPSLPGLTRQSRTFGMDPRVKPEGDGIVTSEGHGIVTPEGDGKTTPEGDGAGTSLPGLTRQSIPMDARIKSGHDGVREPEVVETVRVATIRSPFSTVRIVREFAQAKAHAVA